MITVHYTMGDNGAFLYLRREIQVDTARLICYHLRCLNQVQEVLIVEPGSSVRKFVRQLPGVWNI